MAILLILCIFQALLDLVLIVFELKQHKANKKEANNDEKE